MPARKTGEETNFTYVECLLFSFHHLAHKAPNATNSLCGYKIVTGQPSDRLGEDFSECYKEFTERSSHAETTGLIRSLDARVTSLEEDVHAIRHHLFPSSLPDGADA
ncbi:hypothetical protein V6N12_046005 [Hibiscus sabdariffa]|uniref:Uncharacterized protein n=1 Tax=Hibiscus sabdariffa TaxID=183260 RepID=A0ABR2G4C6_9ROSI